MGSCEIIAGTQVIDRTWDHVKSYIPRTPSSTKLVKCTWNNSCLDETLPNLAMVARSVCSWLLPMGSVRKALQKNTTELDYGISQEDEKKSEDCPLTETLKAPHFYRRRNESLLGPAQSLLAFNLHRSTYGSDLAGLYYMHVHPHQNICERTKF